MKKSPPKNTYTLTLIVKDLYLINGLTYDSMESLLKDLKTLMTIKKPNDGAKIYITARMVDFQ